MIVDKDDRRSMMFEDDAKTLILMYSDDHCVYVV